MVYILAIHNATITPIAKSIHSSHRTKTATSKSNILVQHGQISSATNGSQHFPFPFQTGQQHVLHHTFLHKDTTVSYPSGFRGLTTKRSWLPPMQHDADNEPGTDQYNSQHGETSDGCQPPAVWALIWEHTWQQENIPLLNHQVSKHILLYNAVDSCTLWECYLGHMGPMICI